jgi:MFS family permease
MIHQSDLFEDEGGTVRKDELQPLILQQSSSSGDKEPIVISRQADLLRLENLAVPVCYLVVGMIQGLSGPLMNVYPLDLGANEASQVTLSVIVQFPGTIKIAYGFLSDSVPILGARRKPYMWMGWILVMCTMILLMSTTDLSMEYDDREGFHTPIPPLGAPSIEFLSAVFFLLGLGLWLADVMGDALVAEPGSVKGNLQSSCYACRFFGMMVTAPLSTVLYSQYGPKSVVMALGLSPMIVIPLIVCLREDKLVELKSIRDRMEDIWGTVKSRSVWQPMAFVSRPWVSHDMT